MSLGRRRPRSQRGQLRPTIQTIDLQRERLRRRRAGLARLTLLALSVVATTLIVHGTGPAFTYRIGQKPTRELRVNVPNFEAKNQRKTLAAVQQANDSVVPIMTNDPAAIVALSKRLIDLANAVSKSPDQAALGDTLRGTWNLDEVTYDELKAATDTPERRNDLEARINKAFAPTMADGILGPDTLPRNEQDALAVQIATPDGSSPRRVPIDRIKPERLVKADSEVARDFITAFPNPSLGQHLFALVAEKLAGTPTLTYDEATTSLTRKQARDAVRDVYDPYQRGDLLVEQDQSLTEDHLALLRLEHAEQLEMMPLGTKFRRAGAIWLVVASLFGLVGYYITQHEQKLAESLPRLTSLCILVVGAMGLSRLLALQPWDAELIPIALTGMILAIAYNPHFALMVTFAMSLLLTLGTGGGIGYFIVLMGGTAAGTLPINHIRSRTKPIRVGLTAALGYFLLTWATGLWQNQPLSLVASDSLWRAGWGLMAGFFLGGLLPFIENMFGIVTGISLLELGDINHPLLQELVRRAPGTHNHSVTVGTIAEAAAERIGGNSLLIRVGAYFHDIGKMLKPHYFIENQMGASNRHANLAPAMSTLIIIGHVKDGVELGRQHNLPEPIIDLIEQHHGTTLVEYFYREAKNRSGNNPDISPVQESSFRYPGPKPQSREAGILMVADAVESASRTLNEPTPSRIEGLVTSLVEKRLEDGQFDECGLTLREIAEIRDSLIKSLIGIYHGRVKYPEQRTA